MSIQVHVTINGILEIKLGSYRTTVQPGGSLDLTIPELAANVVELQALIQKEHTPVVIDAFLRDQAVRSATRETVKLPDPRKVVIDALKALDPKKTTIEDVLTLLQKVL